MFIGFSQIFTYYIIKIPRGMRSVIGIAIILSTFIFWPILTLDKENPVIYVIYFIVISEAPHNPLLPYISICFFASTFGEILMEVDYLDSKDAKRDAFRIFIRNGYLFVITGLLFSFLHSPPFLPEVYNSIMLYFPIFVYRSTASNMFYSIGIALLLIAGLYYYVDIKEKNNYITKVFIFYGKISLSLFLIHYIWLPLYVGILDLSNVWYFYVGFIAFLGFLMYIWNHQFEGKYSLEWMMGGFKTKKYKTIEIKNKKENFKT